MYLPPPFIRPSDTAVPAAVVYVVSRTEDVLWNRPVFKAPPLVVRLPSFGAKPFGRGAAQLDHVAAS